jgi:hypothetical protein
MAGAPTPHQHAQQPAPLVQHNPLLVQARARTSAQGWFWAVAPGPCCGQLCMRPPTHTAQQGQQHTRFLRPATERFLWDWLPGRARPGAAAATHHTRPASHGGGPPASQQARAEHRGRLTGWASPATCPPASQKGGGRTHTCRGGCRVRMCRQVPPEHGVGRIIPVGFPVAVVARPVCGAPCRRPTHRQGLGNTAQGQWPSTGGPLGNRANNRNTVHTQHTPHHTTPHHTTPRRTEAHAPHKAMRSVLPSTNKQIMRALTPHGRICCRRPGLVAPQPATYAGGLTMGNSRPSPCHQHNSLHTSTHLMHSTSPHAPLPPP